MNTSHKKTAPVVAATETANENMPNSSRNDSTPIYLYIEDHGKSTGVDFVTVAGQRLSRDNTARVLIHFDTAMDMYHGAVLPTTIDPECAKAHAERMEAKREQQRREEIRIARHIHERDVIERITGRRYGKEDLTYQIVDDYRAGRDITKWLDALKALDDEALAAAGRTSWEDDEDE
ncbi:hypothetical protein [Corynebacterium hindlerae]|uniref:hypothetical protein n=1 Tax=Corynebacterium hindlerae TaxID=699041 RepID=UPI003AAF0EA9